MDVNFNNETYTPTEKEKEIMTHALGLDRGEKEYRNHYNPGDGSEEHKCCENLFHNGLMNSRSLSWVPGLMYHVTDLGRQAIGE